MPTYVAPIVPERGGGAFPMSEEHRRFCAHAVGTAEPWVTGWEFGDPLAGGVAPYHPNAAGMRAVADLLVAQLS